MTNYFKVMNYLKLIPCFYLPTIVFLINKFLVVPFGIYQLWGWFDIPMHIIGGCAIAYSFILVLRKLDKEIIIKKRFLEIIIIIGLLSFIIISWEFYEFLRRMILEIIQNTLEDTLLDLLMGLIGGLVIASTVKVTPKK